MGWEANFSDIPTYLYQRILRGRPRRDIKTIKYYFKTYTNFIRKNKHITSEAIIKQQLKINFGPMLNYSEATDHVVQLLKVINLHKKEAN